jgi:ADP-L-glycero-D-manno-heptose 6-epimerase
LEFLEGSPQTLEFGVKRVLGADLEGSLERQTHQSVKDHPDYHFCLAQDFLETLVAKEDEFGTPPIAIIHNGACSSTTETDPEIFRTLNVESSQALFNYCSERQLPFLYASSASVYGDGSLGFSDAVAKNSLYSPLNLYGRSKHNFDSWVLEQEQKPPTWFGLRYFNVFGPFEEHKLSQASVLHWGRSQIESSGRIKLFKSHRPEIGDGEQKRDFVSVFDVIRVTLELLKRSLEIPDLPHNGLFVNIGRGEAATWIETAEALFRSLGRVPQIEFIDMPPQLQEHYQNYTEADLATLHSLGLTQPFLTLQEAFERSLRRMEVVG